MEINKNKIFEKWIPILEKLLPDTDPNKIYFLSRYAQMHKDNEKNLSEHCYNSFNTVKVPISIQKENEKNLKTFKNFQGQEMEIIPLSIKIAQETIGGEIVGTNYWNRKFDFSKDDNCDDHF